MKPIRGPIDYGGYPPRKRSKKRAAHPSEAIEDAATSAQPGDEHDEARAQAERAARLHSRAQQFRQATHDADGFETHGHVVVPHQEEEKPKAATVKTEPSKVLTWAEQEARARRKRLKSERLEQERLERERLQRKAELQVARRDRNSVGWKRVRRLTWIAASVVGIQVVGLALTQPEMNVRRVNIEGAHLTSPDVLEKAQAKFVGQNWLRVRTGETANQLKTLPAVQNVRIVRRATWPPQLTIAITERQPFIRIGNEQAWWVADKNGVPFRRASANDNNLDAFYDAAWKPTAGKQVDKEMWTRTLAFTRLLKQERAAGHDWKLRRVYFDTHGFVSLRLSGGFHNETLLQLGGEQWPQKLERARQSLAYLQDTGRRASVLNLITYAMPVWTPRSPSSSNLQAGDTTHSSNIG